LVSSPFPAGMGFNPNQGLEFALYNDVTRGLDVPPADRQIIPASERSDLLRFLIWITRCIPVQRKLSFE
jgi:hypothetical protein